jgi:hypothetical protein
MADEAAATAAAIVEAADTSEEDTKHFSFSFSFSNYLLEVHFSKEYAN